MCGFILGIIIGFGVAVYFAGNRLRWKDFEGSKKVIEINTNHELIKKLPSLTEDLQKATCRVIFEQARIQDGEMPTNTRQFSQDLIKLVLEV